MKTIHALLLFQYVQVLAAETSMLINWLCGNGNFIKTERTSVFVCLPDH